MISWFDYHIKARIYTYLKTVKLGKLTMTILKIKKIALLSRLSYQYQHSGKYLTRDQYRIIKLYSTVYFTLLTFLDFNKIRWN